MKIAYGKNRHEKDFAGIDIVPGKFFIDTNQTQELEREAMLFCVRQGVTVVVLSMADLGRGAGQRRIVEAIEAAGGTVEVAEAKARPSMPLKDDFTPEQNDEICRIWGNPALSEATRLARIKDAVGIELRKSQVYYICVTKPKRKMKK